MWAVSMELPHVSRADVAALNSSRAHAELYTRGSVEIAASQHALLQNSLQHEGAGQVFLHLPLKGPFLLSSEFSGPHSTVPFSSLTQGSHHAVMNQPRTAWLLMYHPNFKPSTRPGWCCTPRWPAPCWEDGCWACHIWHELRVP